MKIGQKPMYTLFARRPSNISGYIQGKTLIRCSLERLEDALKHAVIRSDAPLKCLSEKIFEMCFLVM